VPKSKKSSAHAKSLAIAVLMGFFISAPAHILKRCFAE
jgi:hypothetical protein